MSSAELVPGDDVNAWLQAFPEQCRDNCSIARYIITELIKNGEPLNASRAAECYSEPIVIEGVGCSTHKNLCSHRGSGSTDDFFEQTESLLQYVRAKL